MRPINKGEPPRSYTEYKYAKIDLKKRIGSICSYCEMYIGNQPDIEHVIPKSKDESKELEWDNFLIACKTCNRAKSNINDSREGYPFPDEYNTAYLFKYYEGEITVNEQLNDADKKMAKNLFDLLKFYNKKDSDNRVNDICSERRDSFEKAEEVLKDYIKMKNCTSPKETVINMTANNCNQFISVWLEVFKDHPEVKKEIIKNIKGTAIECYDENINPIQSIHRDKK